MTGSHGNGGEAEGRMASMVMKQKAMSAWAQFGVYFFLQSGTPAWEWFHVHLRCLFPPQSA